MRAFENLVEYVTSGNMVQSEVSVIVAQLKQEKAKIMKNISNMPRGKERQACYMQLHSLMDRLYGAIIVDDKKKKEDEKTYKSVAIVANMVKCYDC